MSKFKGIQISDRRVRLLAVAGAVLAVALPAEDRPLRIIQEPAFDYPESARTSEYPTGGADVMIYVDREGELQDALLLSQSDPAFGRAALEAVRAWSYEAAVVEGEPTSVRKLLQFSFSATGSVVSRAISGHLQERLIQMVGVREESRVALPEALDAPLAAARTISPRPVEVPERIAVTVDFFVDEEGAPRMPVVREMEHRLAAASAIEAILQWRFEPPRRRGEPAMVRASQQFVFQPLNGV